MNLVGGNYNISAICNDDFDEDGIGNFATEYGTFNLFVDSQSPTIVRVFKDDRTGKLTMITDEDGKCAYGIQANYCSEGKVDDGRAMTVGFSNVHSTTWEGGQTYYIKCKDVWGNSNTDCAIKVRQISG